jgi:nicotinamide mononucleotide transporter
MNKIKYFEDWNRYEKIWLISFSLLILLLSFYWEDSWIGIIASLTGIWTVILVAKGKVLNYYFGIPNIILYSYLAYGWQYYGEVMLNLLYFLPMQIIGLSLWMKNKNSKKDLVIVKKLSIKQKLTWILISVLAIIMYNIVLIFLNGRNTFLDSITTVLSVVAMILMVLRYVEQWIIWIIVNVFTIMLWVLTLLDGGNNISILIMWSAYLINAGYGYYTWNMLYKKQRVLV